MAKHNNILPDDILLFQILPKLPARSLGRFMCVCKQWHSFLTTPDFTKMHLHHVNNNQNYHKLLLVSATNYFCTIDCETPEVGFSAKHPLPFKVGNNRMSVISSLNGLVCVGIELLYGGCSYLDIVLWNPLTGDYKTMSKDNNNCFRTPPTRGYGLYYSSCDDDYKLLVVTLSSDAYIYSWKSDSWRKAKSRVDLLLKSWDSACLVNEKLYFLAKGTQGCSSEISSLIIRFDTKTEMFTEMATPSWVCFHMTVVGGCIHLSTIRYELWKMDGDREWTNVIRDCDLLCHTEPLHLMKNGNWLLCSIREVFVLEVDRKEEYFKNVRKHAVDSNMHILSRGKFVETIVSLKW